MRGRECKTALTFLVHPDHGIIYAVYPDLFPENTLIVVVPQYVFSRPFRQQADFPAHVHVYVIQQSSRQHAYFVYLLEGGIVAGI